jgi:nucleoside-diphosphate-sugar epimerase
MWGDGKQTRSFTYIDDCVEGILRITKSDFREPLNLGSCEMVSMNEMMEIAQSFGDKVRSGGVLAARAPARCPCALCAGGVAQCCGAHAPRPVWCALGHPADKPPCHAPPAPTPPHPTPPHPTRAHCRPQMLPIKHIPGPEGVRGRNSDNTLILEKLGWQPTVSLRDGLRMTYFWIKDQIAAEVKARGVDAASAYATSAVVKTGAPTELGQLRRADGDEGFDTTTPVKA